MEHKTMTFVEFIKTDDNADIDISQEQILSYFGCCLLGLLGDLDLTQDTIDDIMSAIEDKYYEEQWEMIMKYQTKK